MKLIRSRQRAATLAEALNAEESRERSAMKWIPTLVALATLITATTLVPTLSTAAPSAPQDSDHRMRVKIAVKDFKRSIEFYGILGMQPGYRHSEAQRELNWPGEMSGI